MIKVDFLVVGSGMVGVKLSEYLVASGKVVLCDRNLKIVWSSVEAILAGDSALSFQSDTVFYTAWAVSQLDYRYCEISNKECFKLFRKNVELLRSCEIRQFIGVGTHIDGAVDGLESGSLDSMDPYCRYKTLASFDLRGSPYHVRKWVRLPFIESENERRWKIGSVRWFAKNNKNFRVEKPSLKIDCLGLNEAVEQMIQISALSESGVFNVSSGSMISLGDLAMKIFIEEGTALDLLEFGQISEDQPCDAKNPERGLVSEWY